MPDLLHPDPRRACHGSGNADTRRGRSKGEVSILKLHSLVEALGYEPDGSYFEELANLENFLRHCRYEKRKRKPLPQRLDSLG